METTVPDWDTFWEETSRKWTAAEWDEDWGRCREWLVDKLETLDRLRGGMAKNKGFDERRLQAMEVHMFPMEPLKRWRLPIEFPLLDGDCLRASNVPSQLTTPSLWDAYEWIVLMRMATLSKLDLMDAQELEKLATEQLLEQLAEAN